MSLMAPLLCCLLSILAVVYRDDLLDTLTFGGSRARVAVSSRYELIVAILSARDNWALRQAARDSWLQAVTGSPSLSKRVLPRFVIGSHACDIHPEDREDPYSCSFLNITLPTVEREIEAVTPPEPGSAPPPAVPRAQVARPALLGLDVRVRHPVVVTALGVFARPDGAVPNVTVRLHNAATREVLAAAHFAALSPGVGVRGCRYKPVQQFTLPKGFEGTVVWDGVSPADTVLSDVALDAGGGVLQFAATGRYGEIGDDFPEFRQERVVIAGSFTYVIQDGASLAAHVSGRERRSAEWAERMRREAAGLRDEAARHGDLVLVNVTDVYRSLPAKMLLVSRWAAASLDFGLLLKTDDDSYVDVEEVLSSAEQRGYDRTPRLWWGSFRRNWAVDHAGKWAELSYPGPAYPAFACGAAYVLSADLVRWLAANADVLAAYQGEDVSMGIWMAAVAPTRIQDDRWWCDSACGSGALASSQHSPTHLAAMWARRQRCGDACVPCGAPGG